MRVVYKYPLEIVDEQHVKMPMGAQLLSVQDQNGDLCLWALVDTTAALTQRKIRIAGTGHAVATPGPGAFIGTVQQMKGAVVWHVFDAGQVVSLGSTRNP
jgi:hypothetical protein